LINQPASRARYLAAGILPDSLRLVLAIALLAAASPAQAGPPYTTDDPDPTDQGHWENYLFATGTHADHGRSGDGGLELNYGAAENLQLSTDVPLQYETGNGRRVGAGGLELGAKYRFAHQSDGSFMPDAAIYPSITLPTASRKFGARHAALFLPVWMEWDIGDWSTFGGGGYQLNPGQGNRNYRLIGWAVSRKLGPKLSIGAEIYHQGADTLGGSASTNLGLGVTYAITEHLALMASGGPAVHRSSAADRSSFYASIQFTR
jgi:hypothetical protein